MIKYKGTRQSGKTSKLVNIAKLCLKKGKSIAVVSCCKDASKRFRRKMYPFKNNMFLFTRYNIPRGFVVDVLLLDDADLIPYNELKDRWYPLVSTKNGKVYEVHNV